MAIHSFPTKYGLSFPLFLPERSISGSVLTCKDSKGLRNFKLRGRMIAFTFCISECIAAIYRNGSIPQYK
jgi:hypothetical protein